MSSEQKKANANVLRTKKANANVFRTEKKKKFSSFLPKFPLPHLLKSMITILFSAYNDAGLFYILRYVWDDYRQTVILFGLYASYWHGH